MKVGGGGRYFGHPPKDIHLGLSIARADEDEIEIDEGCRRLGTALRQVLDEHGA